MNEHCLVGDSHGNLPLGSGEVFPTAEINGKALTDSKGSRIGPNKLIFPYINQILQFTYGLPCPIFLVKFKTH